MSSNIEIEKICQHCGSNFIAKTTVTKYCSHKCASNAYKLRQKKLKINNSYQETIQQKIISNKDVLMEEIKQKEFLSIKEAHTLVGISERSFYRLMKAGTIKYKKLGKRTIIKRSEINKLFEI